MLQIIVTRGLRGTERYPAPDRVSAETTVRRLLAGMIADDRATKYGRLHPDRPDAWKVETGKYRGDVIQIIATDTERFPAAEYNLTALTAQLCKRSNGQKMADEQKRNGTAWGANPARMTAQRNDGGWLSFAAIEPLKICTACKGTGKDRPVVTDSFILIRRPRSIQGPTKIEHPKCPACKGRGQVEA